MSLITIPQRLNDVLSGNKVLQSGVLTCISVFEPWLGNSTIGLPFFPEYTDHGVAHIGSVLRGACDLITGEAWALLTPEDAAIIVISTLLHDAAMHLTEDGFLNLIRDPAAPIAGFDDLPWTDTWNDFFAKARRWNGRELKRILGDGIRSSQNDDLHTFVKQPQEMGDSEKWPKIYRRFIGEFIRRNHARIAHEIALAGVPGPMNRDKRVKLSGLSTELADLSGLVARSHNLALRSTFDYLQSRFDGRVTCRNAHPIYLMVLLRIADFLEIKSERASEVMLQIQSLRNPISRREWSAHGAVVEVRADESDREALFIVAKPPDIETFLRIKSLLSDLQEELDISWAVLGEVYSKHSDLHLDKLGIKLRRIRSNIDDPTRFAKTSGITYVPVHAAFEADGAELLKLLITPLYGDKREIGIREIVQNAIDAVLELREFRRQRVDDTALLDHPGLPHGAAVYVGIKTRDQCLSLPPAGPPKEWKAWIEISDCGIGMAESTIRNYFLKAGASFRKSDAWKSIFDRTDMTDSVASGANRILRSGRFGIGSLAAFLLGSELQVTTRNVMESQGVQFHATIDDENVELRYVPAEIGTIVRIKLNDTEWFYHKDRGAQMHEKDWDWFCLDDPKVVRQVFDKQPNEQRFHLPARAAELPKFYRRIQHSAYDDIQWTYKKGPYLTCNGIVIDGRINDGFGGWAQQNRALPLGMFICQSPNIYVFDSMGNLPLTLQRNGLTTDKVPFESELVADIARDIIGCLLASAPKDMVSLPNIQTEYTTDPFPTVVTLGNGVHFHPFVATQTGLSICDAWHVDKSNMRSALIIPNGCSPIGIEGFVRCTHDGIFFVSDQTSWNKRKNLANLILGDRYTKNWTPFSNSDIHGGRIVIERSKAGELMRPYGLRQHIRNQVTIEAENKRWMLLRYGDCLDSSFNLDALEDHEAAGLWDGAIGEVYFSTAEPEHMSPLAKLWQSVISQPQLSYDASKREKTLKAAEVELGSYLTDWLGDDSSSVESSNDAGLDDSESE